MEDQELVGLFDELPYTELNERERAIFEQGFMRGHLRGYADGEAKQKVLEKKAQERFVNDLRASWRQPAF